MAEIKSALEIAMERAEKFGRPSQDEMKGNMYLDEGRRLAARYLREEALQITALLESQPASERQHVIKGMEETLMRNIVLPRDEDMENNVAKALRGLLKLKKNMGKVQKMISQMEEIFRTYRRTVEDARQQLKARFSAKLGDMQRQLGQELGMQMNIDIESQPQYQEQWLQVSAEISDHFNKLLEQQKEALRRA